MKPVIYKTGIYFLLNNGQVVYVGQTTRFPKRLYYHQNQLARRTRLQKNAIRANSINMKMHGIATKSKAYHRQFNQRAK